MEKDSDMNYTSLSDVELLGHVVGPRVAARIYQGAVAPLFSSDKEPTGREKIFAARESIRRMLAEEMRRDHVLANPTAARDSLKALDGLPQR